MGHMKDDRWRLPPAYDAATREQYAADARSFQEREVRRSRRASLALTVFSIAASAVIVTQAIALSYAVPSIRLQPVYLAARPDGTFDAVGNQWAQPAELANVQKLAWLWQYVQRRESFNRVEAPASYDVVSAMSAPEVREKFQAYWNDRIPGSPSPAKLLGKDGSIRLTFRDSELLPNNRFQVRYCRYVQMDGQPVVAQPMIVSLTYQQLDTVPLLQRTQYNPGALVVTGYPGAVQQGTGASQAGDCGPIGAF